MWVHNIREKEKPTFITINWKMLNYSNYSQSWRCRPHTSLEDTSTISSINLMGFFSLFPQTPPPQTICESNLTQMKIKCWNQKVRRGGPAAKTTVTSRTICEGGLGPAVCGALPSYQHSNLLGSSVCVGGGRGGGPTMCQRLCDISSTEKDMT